MKQQNKGIYDSRNSLNNLTGKEWIKMTKSFWLSEKCADDKDAFAHPAPFLIKDIEKLIKLFTKEGMKVLDPFVGSGTTIISAYNTGRFAYGIDLSKKYYLLAKKRFDKKQMINKKDYVYIVGDSLLKIDKIPDVDFIVTSPPYHNILKNNSHGTRFLKINKNYRMSKRQGIEYYSDKDNDLGNQKDYKSFLSLFGKIMGKAFSVLKKNKYCAVIISDFTVNKKEICVQGDIVKVMNQLGFTFEGTIALLQDNKPLYPFGYPYAFKINHMHQNIILFRK